MKLRLLIWVSLGLNLALGAALFFAKSGQAPVSPPPVVAAPVEPIAAGPGPEPEPATNAAVSAPGPEVEAFTWPQVASGDYKTYRDNLFAIGCPTQTVHEIILAVINHNFRERRDLLIAGIQPRFWDTAALGKAALETLAEPVKKLGEERDAVIAEVLGGESPDDSGENLVRQKKNLERRYAWLPTEKRAQLVALELEQSKQRNEMWKADQANTPEGAIARRNEEKRIQAEFAERRKQLLTPEENQELTLRNSGAANWARNVPGFEVSEAEWRAVAQLRLQFDEAQRKLNPPPETEEALPNHVAEPLVTSADPAAKEEIQRRLKAELDAATKAALGESRFAEYQEGIDGNYRQTQRITDRYGLPASLAKQVYEMQRTAQNQARHLQADRSLTPEARAAALAAMRQETERSLTQTLGTRVFTTYQEYNGDWLNAFSQPHEE